MSRSLRKKNQRWPVPLILCSALALLLVGAAIFWLFWRPEAKSPSDQLVATSNEEISAPLPLLQSKTHLDGAVQAEIDHLDPALDGWISETSSDQSSVALKEIGKRIIEVAARKMAPDPSVPHSNARCKTLLPRDLEIKFRDEGITVARWSRNESQATELEPSDDRTFGAAVTDLFAGSTTAATDFRIAFKNIRSEGNKTKTKVQMSFVDGTTLVQHNAEWMCTWAPSNDNMRLAEVRLERVEEVRSELASQKILTDCTESVLGKNASFQQQLAVGVDDWRDTLDWRLGLDVAGPHGLAVGDANGDGLPDLFVCEPGGLPNRLYLQEEDGTARDASATSGLDWLEPAASALFLDIDNDGDQDLVFTSGRYVVSCENMGSARFERKNVLSMTGVARSIAAADFDKDGLIDIFVCCYLSRDVALDDVGLGMPMPYHDANNGPANVMFKNHGNWKFEDVTRSVGLDQNNRKFSYAAAWEDYDNDGDVDLYVANDFGRNNLYQNTNGTFVDVAAAAGVEDIATGMSVSWGDYNRDGHMDLYVGNMFSTAGNRVMYQRRFQSDKDDETRDQFRRLARGNSLFRNNGDGTFRDVSVEESVTFGRWSWASLFVDLNNDGWEDILVANGMITSDEDPGDL